MDDLNPRAVIGDNRAPLYDQDAYAALEKRLAELADAGGKWLDLGEVTDEAQAARLVDAIAQVKKHSGEIEKTRKAAKQPHLDAGRAVDAAFDRLLKPISTLSAKMGALLTAWQIRERDRKAAEQRQREAEARAAEEAARKAAVEAEARNDVIGAAAAEEAAAEAAKAAKQAAKPVTVRTESATGGARTAGLRTYHKAAFDPALPRALARGHLIRALCESPAYAEKIDEFLLGLAEAAKRSATGPETLPGVTFTTQYKAV